MPVAKPYRTLIVDDHATAREGLSNREYQTLCVIASGLAVSATAEKLTIGRNECAA